MAEVVVQALLFGWEPGLLRGVTRGLNFWYLLSREKFGESSGQGSGAGPRKLRQDPGAGPKKLWQL